MGSLYEYHFDDDVDYYDGGIEDDVEAKGGDIEDDVEVEVETQKMMQKSRVKIMMNTPLGDL